MYKIPLPGTKTWILVTQADTGIVLGQGREEDSQEANDTLDSPPRAPLSCLQTLSSCFKVSQSVSCDAQLVMRSLLT